MFVLKLYLKSSQVYFSDKQVFFFFFLTPLFFPWIIKKAREFQKNIYLCFIDYAKAFDCVDHNNCGKFWKRWEYQTTWPSSWEICVQVRKQQLELDMEQQTGSK